MNEVLSKKAKILRSLINFHGNILIFKEFEVSLKRHFKFQHFSKSSRTCINPGTLQKRLLAIKISTKQQLPHSYNIDYSRPVMNQHTHQLDPWLSQGPRHTQQKSLCKRKEKIQCCIVNVKVFIKELGQPYHGYGISEFSSHRLGISSKPFKDSFKSSMLSPTKSDNFHVRPSLHERQIAFFVVRGEYISLFPPAHAPNSGESLIYGTILSDSTRTRAKQQHNVSFAPHLRESPIVEPLCNFHTRATL